MMASDEYGAILEVSTTNLGTTFAVDAAISATALTLTDVSMFEELGGQAYIDGTTYYYVSVDHDANTMELLTGLVAAAVADDTRVEVFPPAPIRTALVAFGIEEGEAVRVTIPHFFSGMPDGIRPAGAREVALVEQRNPGELYLKDVMAKGMILLGVAEDLDDYTSQGTFIQLYSADAAGGANYPVPYAGVLEVLSTHPAVVMAQRYTAYRNASDLSYPSAWVRTFGEGTWSPWKPLNVEPHHFSAVASTTATATTTPTLIPGMTINITPASLDAVYQVTGSIDYSATSGAAAIAFTSLYVDSTLIGSDITYSTPGQVSRGTGSQTWLISGLSVAAHTFQLRLAGTSGVTGYTVHTNSRLSIIRQNY